ncbi:MAG: P1 family peptidase [Steroidobacteraceae bacterium]
MGKGPVRTGVTAILPRGKDTLSKPVFAGWYSQNGNGEMTGTTWVEESGFLEGPVMITNTHSVGVVRDAVIQWRVAKRSCRRDRLLVVAAGGGRDLGWLAPATPAATSAPSTLCTPRAPPAARCRKAAWAVAPA